jgi:choline dehydrogenase-like flavoprotein
LAIAHNTGDADVLSEHEQRTLAAVVERVIPADTDPGAREAGVAQFILRYLSGIEYIYADPAGNRFRTLTGKAADAWRARVHHHRCLYRDGLRRLDAAAQAVYALHFIDLSPEQQDDVLRGIESDERPPPARSPPANQPVSTDELPFFPTLILHTRQGYYSDPIYGGNTGRVGWRTIGYEGPESLDDVRSGAFTLAARLGFSAAATTTPLPASPLPGDRPQRATRRRASSPADVCIVGVGAAGATAANVLARAGLRTIGLERGPWLRHDEFAPDELAVFNRYAFWPDPQQHPRTYRTTPSARAREQPFCPVPSLVGGGTIHWSAWVPRMTLSDFRPRSIVGDIEGATLVDWPIDYAELEPYYEYVEQALGVAGQAGANRFEAPRRGPFPLPPVPQSRHGAKFAEACVTLGWDWSPMPQAIATRNYRGRPQTRHHGFVQQYGDPTGSLATAMNTVLPAALATGRFELRPNSYVTHVATDRRGRACSVLYVDENGREAVQHAERIILACGAMETARLLLLSSSGKFPDGLANSSGLVGRNLTLHEYTFAIGLFSGEPLYSWAASYEGVPTSFEFYEHDERRGHALGSLLSCSGLGHPINFTYPGRPTWGPAAKDADRQYFSRSMKVGVLVQDLPQESNRVDLDPELVDAWGLPVLRVTHQAHPNDLVLGNWMVDRAAELLAAAGADKVLPVHIDAITGNCAHQHGTARMGLSPATSVVDRHCRAHDVPNLYVFDGSIFPTSTGVNPTLTIMANAWRCAEALVREATSAVPQS